MDERKRRDHDQDEKTICEVEEWLRTTRRSAPSGFAGRVEEAIAREESRTVSPRAAFPARLRRTRPVAALAALAVAASALFFWFHLEDGEAPSPSPPTAARTADAPSGLVAYDFLFRAKEASEVCLVGDFNEWTVCTTPLRPVGDGLWRVTLELPPGRHEYMFVVDDRWETDPSAPFHADDGFGNQNAVVLLGA